MSEASGSRAAMPPMLYVPCAKPSPSSAEVSVDVRTLGDGRVGLLVYSALDRLIENCGEHQPWILLPTSALADIDRQAPYDVVLLDAELPAEMRRTAGDSSG